MWKNLATIVLSLSLASTIQAPTLAREILTEIEKQESSKQVIVKTLLPLPLLMRKENQ